MRLWLPTFATLLLVSPSLRADLQIAPGNLTLSGPQAAQRLVVYQTTSGKVTGQPEASFRSSDPKVAQVDDAGNVRAIGDGAATITATSGKDQATIKVKVEKTQDPFTWNFRNHVIPVLTRLGCNSGACHGALAGKGGFKLSLRGFAPDEDHFVLTRQVRGRRVNKLEPAHSLILLKPTMARPHGGGLKLEVDSPEYKLLADWIATGAVGLGDKDARVERLAVFPPEALLKPKDNLQILVRAWYSDGSSLDVTRWAKFSSTEDLVAGVDERGAVSVQGHGEATISVSYSNLVATARIVSPHPHQLDAKLFAQAPRHNYIDGLVLKKLESLRIPPAAQCSDNEFIRRLFLDSCGILPTPEEVKKFVEDKRPDRRARLIDEVLQRPEFVDYWSYKWSDLLLISSRKLSQPALRSFYQFVRHSVADNKPWDRFARDIITAQGSNLQTGAANYFILHKEVTDLTETTTVTFLGTSITCARCHNHPLEKWTQDQYWQLASLFSQVGIKNGERPGEFTVQPKPGVDLLHPRRGTVLIPTPLDGKPLQGPQERRQYFADWLTAPDNPYFARAVVNRVWRNFMGRGLIEAEDDQRQTNPPSNEELLDALAKDFIKSGYDVKALIRTIAASAAYQRSAQPLPENKSDDRYYSRYLVRRLPAEVVLDIYSQVTGVPTSFNEVTVGSSGGTAKTVDYPLGTRALQLPDTQLVSQFLDAFGRPERGQPCSCERQAESSVTQALHLYNGQTLNDKLRSKTSRVNSWELEKNNHEHMVRELYQLALCRHPTPQEMQRLTGIMAHAAKEGASRREIIEDLFWAVLTGNEFLFNR